MKLSKRWLNWRFTLPRPLETLAAFTCQGCLPFPTMTHFAIPQTQFLSATDACALVRTLGVAASLRGMADAIQADYLRWQNFDKQARIASHSEGGVIELMPISDGESYAFKYVNGHPSNGRFGLPTVMAFGLLADVATGLPIFLSELTLTTALRTAAMSAVSYTHLTLPTNREV